MRWKSVRWRGCWSLTRGQRRVEGAMAPTWEAGRAGRGAVLDAWPHRGARTRDAHREVGEGVLRSADRQHREGRTEPPNIALGAEHLAEGREGCGLVEAPRGSLAHWIEIEDEKSRTTSLSCRLPGTPRRVTRTQIGLRGVARRHAGGQDRTAARDPAHDPRFDPCLACAVHVYDPQGRHVHHLDTF